MDPDATLAEARGKLARADSLNDKAQAADDAGQYSDAASYWEEVELYKTGAVAAYAALDEWLSKGGFLPSEWRVRSEDPLVKFVRELASVDFGSFCSEDDAPNVLAEKVREAQRLLCPDCESNTPH